MKTTTGTDMPFDIPEVRDKESPIFTTVDSVRYMEGKNGKLWRCPPSFLVRYYYRELYECMCSAFYGLPELNEQEQAAYDAVLPYVSQQADKAEEQFDDLVAGEANCYMGESPVIDLDPERLAYRIAEALIEEGWTPPARERDRKRGKH